MKTENDTIHLELSQSNLGNLVMALETEIDSMEDYKRKIIPLRGTGDDVGIIHNPVILGVGDWCSESYVEECLDDCDSAIESLSSLRDRLKEVNEQYLLRSGTWDENAGPDHESL